MGFATLIAFLLTILITLFISSFLLPMPVSDTGTVRYRSVPYMTFALIIINSLVFIVWQAPNYYQGIQAFEETGSMSMLNAYVEQIWTYGYRSGFMREGGSIGAFVTFTSMFMHADMWHLLGNMVFLWTFGRRLEDACGPWRYLIFYLLAGMVANLGSVLLTTSGIDRPSIGASGAISGVMGAYLLLFPGAQVLCFWVIMSILRVPLVYLARLFRTKGELRAASAWRWTIKVPAWMLLIYFLIRDLLPSLEVMQSGQDLGGVNTLAHLTGFLAALTIFLFVRKDLAMRYLTGRAV